MKYARGIAIEPIIKNAASPNKNDIHINHSQIGEDRKIRNNPKDIKNRIP